MNKTRVGGSLFTDNGPRAIWNASSWTRRHKGCSGGEVRICACRRLFVANGVTTVLTLRIPQHVQYHSMPDKRLSAFVDVRAGEW